MLTILVVSANLAMKRVGHVGRFLAILAMLVTNPYDMNTGYHTPVLLFYQLSSVRLLCQPLPMPGADPVSEMLSRRALVRGVPLAIVFHGRRKRKLWSALCVGTESAKPIVKKNGVHTTILRRDVPPAAILPGTGQCRQ